MPNILNIFSCSEKSKFAIIYSWWTLNINLSKVIGWQISMFLLEISFQILYETSRTIIFVCLLILKARFSYFTYRVTIYSSIYFLTCCYRTIVFYLIHNFYSSGVIKLPWLILLFYFTIYISWIIYLYGI